MPDETRTVYMDYAATTPVKEEVLDAMLPYLKYNYGNPSSLYGPGFVAKEAMDKARAQVAGLINAEPREIFFTSCGSESDNWVLEACAEKYKAKGNHIITTAIEHHAVLTTCEWLEKNGCEVTYLHVDKEGRIDLEELKAAIRPTTVLCSIMTANNEVGTIEPIKEAAAICKAAGVLFHTDAVQAAGNIPIDVKDLGVDFLSMSAHKIYAPKGIGALYVRKGIVLPSFIHGGGQESKRRAGTEAVASIVAFGKAAELAKNNLEAHMKKTAELRDYFLSEVLEKIPYVEVNGSLEHRLPGNINLIFNYAEGENIMGHLDVAGVYVSTGSACNSSDFVPSHVLEAMGLPYEKMYSSVRFTIGDFTTKEDIDYVVKELVRIVGEIRAISPFRPGNEMVTQQIIRPKKH